MKWKGRRQSLNVEDSRDANAKRPWNDPSFFAPATAGLQSVRDRVDATLDSARAANSSANQTILGGALRRRRKRLPIAMGM